MSSCTRVAECKHSVAAASPIASSLDLPNAAEDNKTMAGLMRFPVSAEREFQHRA